MKKFTKWFAVFSAVVMVFGFAACSDDGGSDDDGTGIDKVVEVGGTSVNVGDIPSVKAIDDTKLSGTYDYTMIAKADAGEFYYLIQKGTVAIDGTTDSSIVKRQEKYFEVKCISKDFYDEYKEMFDEPDVTCEHDDENLVIKATYSDPYPYEMPYAKFKEESLTIPEDGEYTEDGVTVKMTFSDKSLRMSDDGSAIAISAKISQTMSAGGMTESGTAFQQLVAVRQK